MLIHLSDEYFFIDETKFFDGDKYNVFDYSTVTYEDLFYSLPSETLNQIISGIKQNRIGIDGIFSSSLFEMTSDKTKYNFVTEEILEELSFLNLPAKNFDRYFFILWAVIIIIFFGIYFASEKVQYKISSEEQFISEAQKEIKNLEVEVEEIKSGQKNTGVDFENLILAKENISLDKILTIITSIQSEVEVKKILITFPKIQLTGTAESIEEIYKYENYLYQNKFRNINNDFIKNETREILFTIDMEI
ncbi:MAG: hypothetical protein ACRCSK_08445 [Fusobacteriaceae bacterium]